MSRYSERHTHAPACAYKPCPEPAEKIVIIGGVPWWVCAQHLEEAQRAAAS